MNTKYNTIHPQINKTNKQQENQWVHTHNFLNIQLTKNSKMESHGWVTSNIGCNTLVVTLILWSYREDAQGTIILHDDTLTNVYTKKSVKNSDRK